MHKWFSTYFDFSRRELNGVSALAVILVLLWGSSKFFAPRNREAPGDFSDRVAEIDRFLSSADKSLPSPGSGTGNGDGTVDETPVPAVEYFKFDPNGLSIVDWKRLGLSERQIRMIKNYEAKGGRFRRKSDLAKIYAITDGDYARLEPYIEIKQETTTPRPSEAFEAAGVGNRGAAGETTVLSAAAVAITIELNDADSVELQYLPGIGPVFASRIVRFRELLGGFHHVSQLLDVYGFDSVRYTGLEKQVYIDTSKIRRIPINSADYQRFISHPFFNHKLANAIVQYRKQHGPYRAIEDLLRIAIVDEEIFRKIAPYLTVDHD